MPPNSGYTQEHLDQCRETVAKQARQYMVIREKINCGGCGKLAVIWAQFRCFHCGIYYCQNCAKDHFGPDLGPTG